MSGHIIPKKTYYTIFAILMVLLVVTVAVAYVDLGPLNIFVAMSIAGVKAVLVVLYFMHVRYSSRLTWIFVGAGVLWLVIMLGLTFTDYASRGWVPFGAGR